MNGYYELIKSIKPVILKSPSKEEWEEIFNKPIKRPSLSIGYGKESYEFWKNLNLKKI